MRLLRRRRAATGVTVADAMSTGATTVAPLATLQQASAEMLDAGAHAAVVVDGARVTGLLRAGAIAAAMADGLDVTTARAGELAERAALVVGRDDDLARARGRMRKARCELAIVVDDDGHPAGLLADTTSGGALTTSASPPSPRAAHAGSRRAR